MSVDQLTAELWGGHPPPSARAQIHNHISALRKAFGGEAAALLRSQPPGYRLAVMPERRDDAAFRRDLEQGRALRAAGDIEAATVSLSRALGRWRGPAYDGVDQPSVRQAAVELDELRLDTVEEWAEAALASGYRQTSPRHWPPRWSDIRCGRGCAAC